MLDLNKCYNMDCLDGLRELEDNSVDLITTDPPYFLINESGSGFMGKDWDSINIEKGNEILLKSKEFVNFVEKFFSLMKVESNTEEVSTVQESVSICIEKNEKTKRKPFLNVNIVEKNLKEVSFLSEVNTNSVQVIAITKAELLEFLNESLQNRINAEHTSPLDILSDDVLFAIPLSFMLEKLMCTVQESALKFPTESVCSERRIRLTLMDEVRINGVIEGMIGSKLGCPFTYETNLHVSTAESTAEEEKYNAIILKHTESHKTIKWIIWLLFVIYVIQKSSGNKKFYTKKDLGYALISLFNESWLIECLRVLKPGAFAFIMSAPRQDVLSRMIVNIEDAGFKTDFTSIYWGYASGMPKAMNIEKAVKKKLGEDASEVEALAGTYSGFNPKPAVEIVLVCMKPLSEKSYTDQALANGHGVTHLDDCRIPTNPEVDDMLKEVSRQARQSETWEDGSGFKNENNNLSGVREDGRFMANLLVCDDVLNDGVVRKGGGGIVSPPSGRFSGLTYNGGVATEGDRNPFDGYDDEGSASRYFDLDAWWEERIKSMDPAVLETFPFLLVPKASQSEKNAGLDDVEGRYMDESRKVGSPGGTNPRNRGAQSPRKNFHSTVKPVKLFSYLITLGSREGDLIVDPFGGSGTTGIAAEILKRKYILFEMEHDYHEIACKRIEFQQKITKRENATPLSDIFKMKIK